MILSVTRSSTFKLALLGAALLWAAFPPVDIWPLAWIAPVPWLLLIRSKKLDGAKPYAVLTLVGFVFWMAALHWLRLPYWATAFGWVALSFYFAFYLPVFIALSRTAVHQLHMPLILAAPIVWTGLELARGHLLTGMTMASLGHTQYRWVQLIQISDLAGAYGVSFVVMFAAACLARALPCEDKPRTIWPFLPAVAIMVAILVYGYARTVHNDTTPGARIALIQGCIDSTIDGGGENPRKIMFSHYLELSRQAVGKYGQLDLIVWPETYFRYPLITYDADAGLHDPSVQAAGVTIEAYRNWLKNEVENSRQAFIDTAGQLHSPLLVGLDSHHYTADRELIYNSAAYVSASGEILGRYDKMHLVMFGEYTPFADTFPWIYNHLTPLSMGMTPGTQPAALQVRGIHTGATAGLSGSAVSDICIVPNICYESVIPHLIRRQINILQEQGREPNVLVNLTNDGWFWGSSELDMHLACGVFRAVECRKPFLIAANTGFSAWIDADGRIIEKGPRHNTATLLAEVRIDRRKSWYLYYGDWPAGICLACCGVFAGIGFWKCFREKRCRLEAGTVSFNTKTIPAEAR
jgi:apolipoprotein N-acyltransferase